MACDGSVVFESPWFSVAECQLPMTQGAAETARYYKINYPRGVVILPVTPDGDFVLIRQYRPVMDKVTIEIPAGAIDDGETATQAAMRELEEETGCRCETLINVGSGVIRVDREDALNYFFLAQGTVPAPDKVREDGIETLTVSPGEFRKLVRDGEFDHTVGLSVFTMAEINHGIKLLDNER